jgi:hypothetical protein
MDKSLFKYIGFSFSLFYPLVIPLDNVNIYYKIIDLFIRRVFALWEPNDSFGVVTSSSNNNTI